MAKKKTLLGLVRVFTPSIFTTLYYYLKYGAKISPKAEVDLSSNLLLGSKCVVSSYTKIKVSGGLLRIGNRAGFASGCFVSVGGAGMDIGENFICGPNVVITSQNYDYSKLDVHLEDQGVTSKGVKIGNNVWIGAGSVVTDGSEIGDNSVVVANSLVCRRYKANSIIQGSPAKVVLRRNN